MDILLIDIDSKIPNLALHKIAKWHEAKGDKVHWNLPILRHAVDKIYASCIFTKNKQEAIDWADYGAEVGGTGYDLFKVLPDEIERFPCRINWGFTTRGCIRNCPFCVVREKEGYIHAVGDLYDVWDGVSKKVTVMDNNILALPEHFHKVADQAIKEKVKIDFNQGLDHRLLTDDLADKLAKLKIKHHRFAFDSVKYEPSVLKAIGTLKAVGINSAIWYVLVGYDSTFEEDLYRLELLKRHDQRAYVMRYEGCGREYNDLAAWANQRQFFVKTTYQEFCDNVRHRSVK